MAIVVSGGDVDSRVELARLETRPHDEIYDVGVDGERLTVSIARISPSHLSILLDGASYNVEVERFEKDYQVTVRDEVFSFRVLDEREVSVREDQAEGGTLRITAPMPGMVVEVHVSEGDTVQADEKLIVLEAMKMQNDLTAPLTGTVTKVLIAGGSSVNSGDLLIEIEA